MLNNVMRLLIGKTGGAANVGTTLATIQKGDVFVINAETGVILTGGGNTVSSAPSIAFVVGTGPGEFRMSSPIDGYRIKNAQGSDYAAAVLHSMTIGNSGESGDTKTIPVENNKRYGGNVVYFDELRLIANKQTRTYFEYTSGASANGFDIAEGLMLDFNSQEDRYALAQVATNGTGTAIANVTCTVMRGYDVITFSGTDATLDLSVGDYIKLGTNGTYKIAEVIDTTNFRLTSEYQGVTEVLSAGTAEELAGVTLFGVKFVGLTIPTVTINKYENVTFEIGVEDGLETLTPEVITAGFKGHGLGIQMQELELKALGKHGVTDLRDFRTNKDIRYFAQEDVNYDIFNIEHETTVEGDLQENRYLPVETVLAFDESANTQRDAVLAILNPWLTSAKSKTISFAS